MRFLQKVLDSALVFNMKDMEKGKPNAQYEVIYRLLTHALESSDAYFWICCTEDIDSQNVTVMCYQPRFKTCVVVHEVTANVLNNYLSYIPPVGMKRIICHPNWDEFLRDEVMPRGYNEDQGNAFLFHFYGK